MHRFVSQIAGYRVSRTIGAAPAENNCDFSKAQGTGLAIRGQTQKGRREAGLFTLLIRRRSGLRSVYGSVLRDDRATPVEAIVDASLHNMVVGAEVAERSQRGGSQERGVAEVVVLVLDLARPVLGEHVFQTGADRVAIAMVAAERDGGRNAGERHGLVVVGAGIAA